ncbi:MAG: aspartyl protease family protein [Nitrososphaerota archaeon]|nr:aspartyl protease family protein [Nitrososphaerota archaeon]
MGFAKARFKLIGDKSGIEGLALVDSGAWYTVIDEELAKYIGVRYTELTVTLTSFSGHKIACREAVVNSIAIEGRIAPFELVAVCPIPESVKELLRRQDVKEQLVVGVHTLERLGYAIDVVTHKLIESPGVLMIFGRG